jgi:23S rRNA pseudouridine1911/1915/1917 synthase
MPPATAGRSAEPGAALEPVDLDFEIIGETPGHLVVAKPPGLMVHPSKPGGPPTLWHGLRYLLAYELANRGQISILTRLDRDTSGLVLVAKSATEARHLGRLMQRGQIAKEYLAIVHGHPAADQFTIDAPILRQGEVMPCPIYLRQCVHPAGKACQTQIKVLRRFTHPQHQQRPFTLVSASPQTGRMHQIRVHLAHAGHPLVGDKLYAGDGTEYLEFIETGWTASLAARLLLPRHALHCTALAFDDLAYHCPLAPDLARWLVGSSS